MKIDNVGISKLNKIKRLKLINSICGIRSVHLVGTKSNTGFSNLAIFSSIIHLGSNPPLLGLISRPSSLVRRDTMTNIIETGTYTINSIEINMLDRAHRTSGKFSKNVSEFDTCDFKEEVLENFPSPFVMESEIKIGMHFIESMHIKYNDTYMIIGEIQLIHTKQSVVSHKESVGVIGLNDYYSTSQLKKLDYVRVNT